MEDANMDFQRASSLSGATTQRELAEYGIQDLIDTSGKVTGAIEYKDDEGNIHVKDRHYLGDAEGNAWTFNDALAAYGTEEWNSAKAFAESYGQGKLFKDLE
jgi:hypothetical protein